MKKFNKKFIFPLLIIALLLASSFAFSQFFDIGKSEKGLIAHYKLDQASEKSFNYADFDGVDDYVDLGNSDLYNLQNNNFSLNFWIKPNFTSEWHALYVKRANYNIDNDYGFWFQQSTNTLKLIYGNDINIILSNSRPENNVWTNVLIIRNDNNIYCYYNGVLMKTTTFSNTFGISNNNLFIGGGNNPSGSHFYNGSIADVRIYNRALSADEISTLAKPANIGRKVVQGGLVGWWDMNGYTDKSGNGNDGTNVGSILGAGKLTADATGNGNDGIIYGASYGEDRFGNTNRVMSFDGVDDKIVGNNVLNDKETATICGWTKRATTGSTISFGTLVDATSRCEIVWYSDGKLYGEVSQNHNSFINATGGVVNDTNWHYLCMVYSGSELENINRINLYFDGILTTSKSEVGITDTSINSSGNFQIGWRNTGYSTGKISDVRIYNYALSDSEISSLYEISKPADIFTGDLNKGLVGHWKMDGGSQGTEGTINIMVNPEFESNWGSWDTSVIQYENMAVLGRDTRVATLREKSTGGANAIHQATPNFVIGEVFTLSTYIRIHPDEIVDSAIIQLYIEGSYTNKTVSKQWQRFDIQRTVSSTSNTIHITQGNLIDFQIAFVQVEQKDYPTPFVDGIRDKITKDSTPYQNNGVINGATLTTGRNGESNGAYNFDGTDDYIDTGNIINIKKEISEFAWIKQNINGRWNGIIGPTTGNYPHFQVAPSSTLNVYVYGPNAAIASGSIYIPINEWKFVGFTFDGLNLRVYVDGVLTDTSVANIPYTDILRSTPSVCIGDVISERKMNGQISDVRIYNRALSDDEVNLLYNSTQPAVSTAGPLEKGLVLDAPLNSQSETGFSYAEFDGVDDYIITQNDIGISGSQERTMSGWFKQDSYLKRNIVGFGYPVTSGIFDIIADGNVRKIYGHFYGSGNATDIGAPSYIINTWYSFALTYDGITAKFYLNGEYINSNVIDLQTFDSKLNISSGTYPPAAYFNGSISDVRIYNRALTDDEITILSKGENINKDVVQSGLVGWWTMNDVDDKSGNGNDGTNNGATLVKSETSGSITSNIKGQVYGAKVTGEYMEFDGVDDYINAGNDYSLQIKSSVSFSLWINFSDFTQEYQYIINKGGAEYGGFRIFWNYNDNGKFYFGVSDGTEFGNYSSYSSLENNKWYHIVGISNLNEISLYLNNIKIISSIGAHIIDASIDNLYLASRYRYGSKFAGKIANTKIYNRALSDDEIQSLYETTKPKVTEADINRGLVLDMPLDEDYVSGTTATDKTSNKNDGTVYGAVSGIDGMSFDGVNDYVDTGINENITEYTLSGWFFRDNTTGRYATIIGSKTDARPGAGFELESLPAGGGSTLLWLYPSSILRTSYSLNEWHFFTVTRNSSKTRLYMDNILIGEENSINTGIIPSMLIGNWKIGSSQYFNGKISNVKLHDRVLNQDEIEYLYNKGR